jgi:predicted amidophosphoribosyltransferase
MWGLIIALVVVFAIGMIIRAVLKKRKKTPQPTQPANSTQPTEASYCPNCGTPIEAGSSFCSNCGAKLN